MIIKICKGCGESKEHYAFGKCKLCYMRKYAKAYHYSDKRKRWLRNNLNELRTYRKNYSKTYYYQNRKGILKRQKERYHKSKGL